MEFKETPFGTEIIGLAKVLNKVGENCRISDIDAFLADVRRLVEAGKYRDNIDNTCRDGWDIFRAKVDLKEAIAAVERHFSSKTSQP